MLRAPAESLSNDFGTPGVAEHAITLDTLDQAAMNWTASVSLNEVRIPRRGLAADR